MLLEQLIKELEVKNEQLSEKDRQIREKDRQIAEMQAQLSKNQKLIDQEQQLRMVTERKFQLLEQQQKDGNKAFQEEEMQQGVSEKAEEKHWWKFWK